MELEHEIISLPGQVAIMGYAQYLTGRIQQEQSITKGNEMATGMRFVCRGCDKSIETWDDGNPYYIENGRKQYAYHPSGLLELCIGNDTPHLCLSCGHEFTVDSNAPITECPECKSDIIARTTELGGKACPYCKKGMFVVDRGWHAIS